MAGFNRRSKPLKASVTFDELSSVSITLPADGDLLVNESSTALWENKKTLTGNYTVTGLSQPYARLNVDFFMPAQWGPSMGGFYLLGDWRINLLGNWSSGYYFTWAGGSSIPGVVNNVQWTDYLNFDMRITKNIQVGDNFNLQLFVDISNLFNYKYMATYGFVTGTDYNDYMQSLDLPAFVMQTSIRRSGTSISPARTIRASTV